MMSSARLFVSYTGSDRPLILPLLAELDRREIPYYDYQREPLEPDGLRGALISLVAQSDGMLSILTQGIITSESFRLELVTAAKYDIPHCIIQFQRHIDGKNWILLTNLHTFIDASEDLSKAIPCLKDWLDPNSF